MRLHTSYFNISSLMTSIIFTFFFILSRDLKIFVFLSKTQKNYFFQFDC